MPTIKLSVPHALGQEGAAERLKTFADKIKEKYAGQVKDFEETWGENNLQFGFKTMGVRIGGNLDILPESVDYEGQLPFAAVAFKGRIEKEIREALTKALS